MKTITSRQNALVTRFRLAARERRVSRRHVLLEGARLIEDARSAGVPIEAAVFSKTGLGASDAALTRLAAALSAVDTEVVAGSDTVMAAASPVRAPSGVVAIGCHRPTTLTRVFRRVACVVAAVGVQDPGNVGALIRAADAAGASGVAVTAASADPFGWKALRGAMGSTFRIPVVDAGEPDLIIETARGRDVAVLATVPRGGRSLYDIDLTRPVLVLVGGEGAGLDGEVTDAADETVSVPMRQSVDSLNTAVATALIVYEARRQRLAFRRGRAR